MRLKPLLQACHVWNGIDIECLLWEYKQLLDPKPQTKKLLSCAPNEPVCINPSDALKGLHKEGWGGWRTVGAGASLSGAQPGVLETRVGREPLGWIEYDLWQGG